MATIGHWSSLANAEKLTQSQLIPGVVEEDVKIGNPLDMCPVSLSLGKSVKWNREGTLTESDVADIDIGDQLAWTASSEYDQQETALKRSYIQRVLDHYIEDVYGTINNYRVIQHMECVKLMLRRLGDKFIYNDVTYGSSKQFDGLHALAALEYTSTAANQMLDIDNASVGLSIGTLRRLLRNMKHGCDVILVATCIYDRINAAYEEAGFAGLATATAGSVRQLITQVPDQMAVGGKVFKFQGVPIVPTDYLVGETLDTGRGSNLRSKNATGTDTNYSLFGIKWGDVTLQQPGLSMAFGNPEMQSSFFKTRYFEELEDYDAAGLRLVTYCAPLLGSSLCLGRIHDITDVPITV